MSWKPVLLIILQMLPALSRCWAAGQAVKQQGSSTLQQQIKAGQRELLFLLLPKVVNSTLEVAHM